MSEKSEFYSKRVPIDNVISAAALNHNLVGPTFSSIPPVILPTGDTG
ncbi:exosporium leader peptide-containing protein, partial [Bacillus toyonensis]